MHDGPGHEPPSPAGEVRPRRTLESPPSARYAGAQRDDAATPRRASRSGPDASSRVATLAGERGALLVSAGGALLIVALNVVFAVTTGLVAVAAVIGYLDGQALRGQGGDPADGVPGAGALGDARGRSIALTMAVAVGAVLAGALGTWLIAVTLQGGVVGPLDYLAQAMGPLLPALVLVAAAGAWLGRR